MTRQLPYDRAERVADAIYQVVSQLVVGSISDPRLREVHITRVRMTKDLRIARIYYHLLSSTDEDRARAQKGFVSAAGFLRRHIGQEIPLKFTPELEFFYDESIDLKDRIDELLKDVHGEDGGEHDA